MSTNYDAIAQEYKASKMLPWRQHLEAYTFFNLTGDISGLHVLDLACGEGFYTRQFKLRGAAGVTGVDISAGMIQLAREEEASHPLGLVYHVGDVLELALEEQFDLICAAYLLNYASNPEQLQEMAEVIARHLKPGGRFVTINSNPDFQCAVESMFPYGFTRQNEGYWEGAAVTYRFYQPDDSHVAVTNYHLDKSTHEQAFAQAGLQDIRWHAMELSPEGESQFGADYWQEILKCQPVVGFSCRKG